MDKEQEKTEVYFNLDKYDRICNTQQDFLDTVEYYRMNKIHEKAKEGIKAYFSDSWPDDVKRDRQNKKLPVGDMARFAPIVDGVSGNERQNQPEEHAFAYDSHSQKTADFVNIYMKHYRRVNKVSHKQSLAFQKGVICGSYHVEFANEKEKDSTIGTHEYYRKHDEVYIRAPFVEYDTSDSPGRFHAQFVDIKELKALYGDDFDWTLADWHYRDKNQSGFSTEHIRDEYKYPDEKDQSKFYNRDKNQVRLIRYWKKEFKTEFNVINLINPQDASDLIISRHKSKPKATAAALKFLQEQRPSEEILELYDVTIEGLNLNMERALEFAKGMVEESNHTFYSYHVITGRLELEYEENYGDFLPWADFFAYFIDGDYDGLFQRVKFIIHQINFIFAKLTERLGKLGKMPIGIEQDSTLHTAKEIVQRFQNSEPIIFKKNKLSERSFKVFEDKTVGLISHYVGLIENLQQNLKEMLGFNDAMQGQLPASSTSGVAIERLQAKGGSLIFPLLDNHRATRQKCAEIRVKMLALMYKDRPTLTYVKMNNIVNGMTEHFSQDPAINDFAKELNDPGTDLNLDLILSNIDSSTYEFAFDDFMNTPSMRMAAIQQVSQAFQLSGQPVPLEIIIQLIDMPNKYKTMINQYITQAQAQMMQQAGIQQPGVPGQAEPVQQLTQEDFQ